MNQLLLRILLLTGLLAGCAHPPPVADTTCCTTPAPGTAHVRINGEMVGGWTVWQRN